MLNHANIRREWDYYQGTVKKIRFGDTAALKVAKDKLGYSLSELVPYLLKDLDTLSDKLSTANGDLLRIADRLQDSDEKLKTSENNVERLTEDIKNGVRR